VRELQSSVGWPHGHRPASCLSSKMRVQRGGRYRCDVNRNTTGESRHMRCHAGESEAFMIRKLKSGEYRLYSRKVNARTGKRRNLGTFGSRAAAEKHERAIQFFKRH
jgi:hypothetical protein